jgi:group I intron endonuclease
MYLIPLLATLMSSLFAGAIPMVSRNLGHRGVVVFSIFSLFIAFISSACIWTDLYLGGATVSLNLFGPWIEVGTVSVSWSLYYDLLTAHMLFTVTSVSLAVHIFATVYMRNDPHFSLFMAYLSLFTFFMLVLVCADNLLIMLVGWEGIGVCSFLLIGYYTHRLTAVKSAVKAILVNRISDGMLLWGILWIWYYTGSVEFDLILLNQTSSISMFIVISILIAAMGKSAQILFHVWLPDAMAGPTPVSALIHAATLVTAGIFLMIRVAPIMAGSDLVIFIGCCTAFMAGVFGFFQADLKCVIAFSTCSQLGYSKLKAIIFYFTGPEDSVETSAPLQTTGYLKRTSKDFNENQDKMPSSFIECFDVGTSSERYLVKTKYKKKAAIYLWVNNLNGRKYVGRTNNLAKRLAQYADKFYLNRTKRVMPICAALALYGHSNFKLYVLEVLKTRSLATGPGTRQQADVDWDINLLSERELFWHNAINPSYNIAPIFSGKRKLTGAPHDSIYKRTPPSQEVRNKISATLKGRTLDLQHTINIKKGSRRKVIYCYDASTNTYITQFDSMREMARQLACGNRTLRIRVDTLNIFSCLYKGKNCNWYLKSSNKNQDPVATQQGPAPEV